MQKTKLGISVGLAGAAIFFFGLFGGYIATLLLAGYVLLFEENAWLKRMAVKCIVLMVAFSVIFGVIGLIPDIIGFIDDICKVFGGSFSISVISKILSVITSALDLLRTVIFLGLGLKALTQGTIVLPVIDNMLNKHMG